MTVGATPDALSLDVGALEKDTDKGLVAARLETSQYYITDEEAALLPNVPILESLCAKYSWNEKKISRYVVSRDMEGSLTRLEAIGSDCSNFQWKGRCGIDFVDDKTAYCAADARPIDFRCGVCSRYSADDGTWKPRG